MQPQISQYGDHNSTQPALFQKEQSQMLKKDDGDTIQSKILNKTDDNKHL